MGQCSTGQVRLVVGGRPALFDFYGISEPSVENHSGSMAGALLCFPVGLERHQYLVPSHEPGGEGRIISCPDGLTDGLQIIAA